VKPRSTRTGSISNLLEGDMLMEGERINGGPRHENTFARSSVSAAGISVQR